MNENPKIELTKEEEYDLQKLYRSWVRHYRKERTLSKSDLDKIKRVTTWQYLACRRDGRAIDELIKNIRMHEHDFSDGVEQN